MKHLIDHYNNTNEPFTVVLNTRDTEELLGYQLNTGDIFPLDGTVWKVLTNYGDHLEVEDIGVE